MALKIDYKDPEFIGKMKYQLIQNGNGTVSFIDRTEYIEPDASKRDYINAAFINLTNHSINTLASNYSLWFGSNTPLKENYIDAAFSGNKQFQMAQSGDIVTLTDITSYSTVGDTYSADDINTANTRLNLMDMKFSNGLSSIKNTLSSLGAVHVDDIRTALNEVIAAQSSQGEAIGIQKVQTHPENYNNASNTYRLCTKATYDAKNASNQTLRANMTTERNALISERNGMQGSSQDITDSINNANLNINEIQAGIPITSAYDNADMAETSTEYAYRFATNAINTALDNIEDSKERLGHL